MAFCARTRRPRFRFVIRIDPEWHAQTCAGCEVAHRRAVFLFIRAQQHGADMRTITFLCPITRVMVQHRLADDEAAEHQFQGVFCPACSQLHFVDRKTGKLLGRRTNDSASSQSG